MCFQEEGEGEVVVQEEQEKAGSGKPEAAW